MACKMRVFGCSIDYLESRLDGRTPSVAENLVDEDDLKLCRRLPFLEVRCIICDNLYTSPTFCSTSLIWHICLWLPQ